jgi:hypothetical protein
MEQMDRQNNTQRDAGEHPLVSLALWIMIIGAALAVVMVHG